MRLIDADKLMRFFTVDTANQTYRFGTIKKQIENAETVQAIPILDNATNGDMIKIMFPNAKFDNAMPFTDNRWETIDLDTENKIRGTYKPTQLRVYADWWNAPYEEKRGDSDDSN